MVNQFLTLPDGSIPPGTDVAALEAAGVLIVRPSPRPDPDPGMVVVEAPAHEADGVWWQTWVQEPAPPPAPLPVPSAVTPLQIRRALRQTGMYGEVIGFVSTQSDDVQDAWEYAVQIVRTDPLIAAAAEALGKTEAEIDDLFRLAVTL